MQLAVRSIDKVMRPWRLRVTSAPRHVDRPQVDLTDVTARDEVIAWYALLAEVVLCRCRVM